MTFKPFTLKIKVMEALLVLYVGYSIGFYFCFFLARRTHFSIGIIADFG